MANPKARLAEAYTCFSPCSSKITDLGLSYTVRGEITDSYESTPHSGGYYHSSTTYYANGAPQTVSGPAPYYMNYTLEGEGRINSSTGSGNFLTGTNYNTAGQITQINYASSDSDTYTYDPNTGRMTQYQFNVGSLHQALTGTLGWNANGTLKNLSTQDLSPNTAGTQSCNFQHDDLSRIASDNCSGNQASNPGFEQGMTNWTPTGSCAQLQTNSTNAHTGSNYVQISIGNGAGCSVGGPLIPVTPGQQITFGGWVNLQSGGGSILGWTVGLYNSSGGGVTSFGPASTPTSSGWTYQTETFTVPTGVAYANLYAQIWYPNTSTVLWVDDGFIDTAAVWQQAFSYDAFGNINKAGNSSFNASYSAATNRMTQIASSTPTYDANGNVTNDFLHTYAWDANGRPVTTDGIGVTYDALGSMVEQNRSGTYSQIAYSTAGDKLQIMSGQSYQKQYVQLVGGAQVVIPNVGTAYYSHPDWLGSARLASTSSQTVLGDVDYAPFGEPYAAYGTSLLSFTGMNQDSTPNDYDFPAREYGIQGRWPSPDPAGLLAVNPSNPQSWNRYAYVDNNPLAEADPTGLFIGPATPCIPCDIGIGIFDFISFLISLFGPPPHAAPAPPGGYGAGIDPYGTWSEKLPKGVQVFPSSITGIPNGSGCTYGSGSCGGVIYSVIDEVGAHGGQAWSTTDPFVIRALVFGLAPDLYYSGASCHFEGDAVCSPGQPPQTVANIQSADTANLAMAGIAEAGVNAAAESGIFDAFQGINNNPLLRIGRGWKTMEDGTAKRIWRVASGGRWGKGGFKLPWHWHWP